MGHSRPLPVGALSRTCPPASLRFRTTADLPDIDRIVGQARAVEAIDLAARAVTVDGELLHLPSKEFDLLAALARDPHRVHMKEDLMERIWGYRNGGKIGRAHV